MDEINNFFKKKLISNENTKRSYRRGIELFFKVNNENIDTYFEKKQDYEKHIVKYWEYLEKNTTQMTRKNRINAIRQFLKHMDRDTRDLEIWETISYRLRNIQSETDDMALDQNDLKKILQYGDICSRSMFLTMASCGCRIGELVQIELDDIYLDEKPARIHFRSEIAKTNRKRDGFISDEAADSLKAWKKIRKRYIESKRTAFGPHDMDDNRVFPMTDVNARSKWHTLIKRAGYTGKHKYKRKETRDRYKAHPHCLRRFFRSYLNNVDLAEHIMGHQGYLSSYRQYNVKQLGKEYLKYVHNVTIFGGTDNSERLNDLQDQLTEKDKQIESMQKHIDEMDRQLRKLLIDRLTEDDKKNTDKTK